MKRGSAAVNDVVADFCERCPVLRETQLTRFNPRHRQEILHQPHEAVDLFTDDQVKFMQRRLIPTEFMMKERVNRGADGSERSTQIVRDRSEQRRLQLIALLK